MEQFAYGFGVRTGLSMAEAEERVRRELAAEGFGVLTEIDFAATLKAKLGVDRPAYRILGACNPSLAHRALAGDDLMGLLLPCNVVVYDAGEATVVAALDPEVMSRLSPGPAVAEVAAEARARLWRALGRLEERAVEGETGALTPDG